MKKLNTKKPYGKVCGAGRAKFEQDGALFDIHGNELLTDEQRQLAAEEAERLKQEQDEADAKAKAEAEANKAKGGKATDKESDPKPKAGKKADVTEADAKVDTSAVDEQLAAQADLTD